MNLHQRLKLSQLPREKQLEVLELLLKRKEEYQAKTRAPQNESREIANKNYISKSVVEELLFQLTENGILPGNKFGELYERLSNLSDGDSELETIYQDLKGCE